MQTIPFASRRVVVTGMGVMSPIGCSKETYWQSLVAGQSGVRNLAYNVGNENSRRYAGEIADFSGKIGDFGPLDGDTKKKIRKSLKVMNRETKLAIAAAEQALLESDLCAAGYEPDRVGVNFGAGYVPMLAEDFLSGAEACTDEENKLDLDRWGQEGIPHIMPLWILKCLPNMPSCHIAILHDFQGPNNSITQGEAATNIAISEACHLILENEADAMVVGGTGDNVLPLSLMHNVMGQDVAETTEGVESFSAEEICRPFDKNRVGSVVAEGAASFILEEESAARKRGATIYGEIVGNGSSCVVTHANKPDCSTSLVNAMEAALKISRLTPDAIDHVHAHGLSAPALDAEESQAILKTFNEYGQSIPVVAAKSAFGNAGAGSGALELAASLLACQHGHLFPVQNFSNPDPQCPLSLVTDTQTAAGRLFANLSVAPQGQASCLIVKSAA